jgi:FkbM family methyltransferase
VAVQQPIRTIVDIGANVGFAATYFRCCFPKSRLFCFEPDPRALATLRLTAEMLGDCRAVPYGLGDEDRKVRFYQGADGTALSSVYRNKFSAAEPIDIDIRHAGRALEALEIERIDLLKIATKGNELPILRNLERYLADVALLFLEFHSEAARHAIERLVEASHLLRRAEVTSAHRGSLFYVRRDLTPPDPLRPPISVQ